MAKLMQSVSHMRTCLRCLCQHCLLYNVGACVRFHSAVEFPRLLGDGWPTAHATRGFTPNPLVAILWWPSQGRRGRGVSSKEAAVCRALLAHMW